MESFLMNNPAILGCWDPDHKLTPPSLVKEQVVLRAENDSRGRIDIIGLAPREEGYELLVFELKQEDIDEKAVDQIKFYLDNWHHKEGPRKEVRSWIMGQKLQGIDESNIDAIIDRPIGVLVGSKFRPEAIRRALEANGKIRGIRLARFKAAKSEYYVIVEEQIGPIISRRYWSWHELIEAGLIDQNDVFSTSFQGQKLTGRPDPKYLKYNWIRLILDDASIASILSREQQIVENSKNDSYAIKWIPKAFEALRRGKSIVLTNASGLAFFAFGGPASYFTPSYNWIHEKSGKSIEQLKNELFGTARRDGATK